MSQATRDQSTGGDARERARGYRYDASMANAIEAKWQAKWEATSVFRTPNPGEPEFDGSKPKFFVLDMFPYPSGAGLHVGHPEGYTATDIVARYKRMRGFNVLHPMGWDAFGLPAEQYAIQTGVHPAETTRKAIDTFRRQLKRFGFSYDWSREFATIDPDYYKWTQWIWLKAYGSWFNPLRNRAEPIDSLVQRLENGEIYVDASGELYFAGITGDTEALGGEPVGMRKWHEFSEEERREVIDNQRLAYIDEQTVNWCPKLGTVLANEEVIDGKSERGGYHVHRQPLRQWMFRITAYAERLLQDLDRVNWPDSTKTMQREWIGKSEGAEIDFPIDSDVEYPFLRVFTTRPDTIFGATYMVVAPEHPMIDDVLNAPATETDVDELRDYVDRARNRSDIERQESKEKTGVFTGVHAINPATSERIPVWCADYVLMGYGHGAIMAVPAHDERDFEFAQKFDLMIVKVVEPPNRDEQNDQAAWSSPDARQWNAAYVGGGVAVNSSNDEVSLDDLETDRAKRRIIEWLEEKGQGRRTTNYRLRDWLFSRQRYWGEPFPVVFDAAGNHYPISETHLPVTLPELEDYQPIESDTPKPPLEKATHWVYTSAGEAGVSPDLLDPKTPVRRETNTMPGWAGSCWYYLRFCDPKNDERFVSRDAERYWMLSRRASVRGDIAPGEVYDSDYHHIAGVDLYIGGSEHAVLHLLYARFWHKILFDLGEVSTPEPFGTVFHQGMIVSHAFQRDDKSLVPVDEVESVVSEDGESTRHVEKATGQVVEQITAKMSKSLKNVVNPDDMIAEFGADTFRLYEMYMGPLEATKPWNTRDIQGPYRFLQRVWRLVVDEDTGELKVAEWHNAPRRVDHERSTGGGETSGSDCPGEAEHQTHPYDAERRATSVERALHHTIRKVGDDVERLAFNTAIAAMMEFVNTATQAGGLTRDQLGRFVRILAPFAPHMAEELWAMLGHETTITRASWPTYDELMLIEETIEMPVQIMGKVRGRVVVPHDADDATVESLALNDERIKEQLAGKTIRKIIVVPGKIVNIVAN